MEDKKTENKTAKKEGVYLSNFVATAISAFVIVLAFAAGFFAKAYFADGSETTTPKVADQETQQAKQAQQPNADASLEQVKDVFNKAAIKFGDTKRKVVFVEASDPSCPYCSIASGKNAELAGDRFKSVKDGGAYLPPVEEMKKLVDQGKASYALIFRNGHGNGELGMKAMYCAFDSGKFWPVHDLLMSNDGYTLLNENVKNDTGKINELVAFLSSAIDQNTLKSCLNSGKYDGRIAEDTKLGDSLSLGGTPSFYVNDKVFAGAYSFVEMQPLVDTALK